MKTHTLVFRASDKVEFDTIVDGRKTIETRAATPKYQKIQAGDILRIKCGDEQIEKKVKKIEQFKSIEKLLSKVALKYVMPLAKNDDEAKNVWYSFSGYREKIEKFGLLAFYI